MKPWKIFPRKFSSGPAADASGENRDYAVMRNWCSDGKKV
jgi:hypothetical protein